MSAIPRHKTPTSDRERNDPGNGARLNKEIRMVPLNILKRAENTDDMIVEGYAIRFNEPAIFEIDGTTYTEVISPKALDKTDMRDVMFKYNHSDNVMVMARTRNRTLELIRDDQGLKIVAHLANTTAGRDLYELIRRGDIDKMSFAFTVRDDEYDRTTKTRVITDIEKLYDVSAVDTPAYETTSISARSFFELVNEKEQEALEREAKRKALLKRINNWRDKIW